VSDIANAAASTQNGVRVVILGAERLSEIIRDYLWLEGRRS